MNFYEEIFVWVRQDDTCAIRYSCLKNLQTRLYCVQSADFYYSYNFNKNQFDRQFLELLLEEDPITRCEWFNSLEGAILQHIKDFS